MDEAQKTILPSDNDPIKLNEIMKDQKKGLEWIKQREEQIYNTWLKRFQEVDCRIKDLRVLAREWADLENDFNYIKELNTFIATRHEEVWDCMPTLTEIDELIKTVEDANPDAKEFFCTDKKENRILKLKKLRSAIAHSLGNE